MSIRKGALKPAVLELKVAASIYVYLVAGRKSVVTSQFLGKPLPGRTNLEWTQALANVPEGCSLRKLDGSRKWVERKKLRNWN